MICSFKWLLFRKTFPNLKWYNLVFIFLLNVLMDLIFMPRFLIDFGLFLYTMKVRNIIFSMLIANCLIYIEKTRVPLGSPGHWSLFQSWNQIHSSNWLWFSNRYYWTGKFSFSSQLVFFRTASAIIGFYMNLRLYVPPYKKNLCWFLIGISSFKVNFNIFMNLSIYSKCFCVLQWWSSSSQ